jgi:topoisomerase-4 subunit A
VTNFLQDIPTYTIRYLEGLIKKYASDFPRKTELQELDILDKRQLSKKDVEVGVDARGGYVGLKVDSKETLSCSNIDRILVLLSDGTYKVYPIADRTYVGKPGVSISWCGVADKQQVLTCCYRDPKSGISFCKRFIVKQFILEREYRWIDEGYELLHISPHSTPLFAHLVPKSRQRIASVEINVEGIAIHGVQARGIRISPRPVLSIKTKAAL